MHECVGQPCVKTSLQSSLLIAVQPSIDTQNQAGGFQFYSFLALLARQFDNASFSTEPQVPEFDKK